MSVLRQNRVVNSAISARFRTERVRNTRIKRRKGWWQKCSGFSGRCTHSWVAYFRTQSAGIFIDFTEGHQSLGTNSTSTIHKSYSASCWHPRETNVHRWLKHMSNFLISAVPTLWNSRTGLRRRLKKQERCAAETRGDAWRLAKKTSWSSKERDKATLLLTYQWMEFTSPSHNRTGGKRIGCRFRREHAHVEQERPELSRIGNRKSLSKSDDGCYNGEVQTQAEAKITGTPTIGPVVKNHNS